MEFAAKRTASEALGEVPEGWPSFEGQASIELRRFGGEQGTDLFGEVGLCQVDQTSEMICRSGSAFRPSFRGTFSFRSTTGNGPGSKVNFREGAFA
jgi:hypothetical protein